MFKVFSVAIGLAFIGLIAGCSSGDGGTNSNPDDTSEGVFCKLIVARSVTNMGVTLRLDTYEAVFDSSYGICEPIEPIHNVDVSCEGEDLVWNATGEFYMYPEIPSPASPLITLGGTYTFTVTAGNGVPALTQSVVFPSDEPIMTTPAYNATVTRSSGMQVEWTGSGSGMVEIMVMSMSGDVGHSVETANDGSHFISSEHMNKLPTGLSTVLLSHYNRTTFSETGYDSRSFKAGRIIHTQMITLN